MTGLPHFLRDSARLRGTLKREVMDPLGDGVLNNLYLVYTCTMF